MKELSGLEIKTPKVTVEDLALATDILMNIHLITTYDTCNADEMVSVELDCLQSLGMIARTLGTLTMTEVSINEPT